MKNPDILRALCIYSTVSLFDAHKYYDFNKIAVFTSYSVYKAKGVEYGYATRLLDECSALVIESKNGLLAVFKVC